MSVRVFFDGNCPFCSRYVRLLRLREAHGDPQLIDVRHHPRESAGLKKRGFDLDQGMIVVVDDRWYSGDEAVHVLALLSSPSTKFNKLNRILFSSRQLSGWIYPLLRLGRNLTLFCLGRDRWVTESASEFAFIGLFNTAFALFAILHAISYFFFGYGAAVNISTALIGIFGVALLLKPMSMRVLAGLVLIFIFDALQQPPLNSNHTIIKNFLLLGMGVAGIRQLWRGGRWSDFYADFAPIGRVLLVTMYVFGIFHKINRDFLNPEVSCAVALWRAMPPPLSYLDNVAIHKVAIYGTFVAEGLIAFSLLMRRTRHWGIALGIVFHVLLALSSYAMYVQFSMLAVTLHILFVEREDAVRIQAAAAWRRLQSGLHSPRGYAMFSGWLILLVFLGWNGGYTEISIVWMPSVLFFAWMCLSVRHEPDRAAGAFSQLWSPVLLANVISILFFLNCAAPYLGLKTSQSINMFANLQLEGGRSNHLVFSNPPGPFGYLSDIVTITSSSGSPLLSYVKEEGLKLTYYQLLDHLERNSSVRVSFERGGERFVDQSAQSLGSEITKVLHPRWMRFWLHFTVVDLSSPKPCAIDR